MNLAREIRYKPYKEWKQTDIAQIKENMATSPWHAHFHIEPQTGLLNDPNGFSYFNGQYHLFYQNWPYGPAHGLKQWVHLVSDDLVHFKETGIKLLPDHTHDSHGAYSGSAYAFNDKLFLFYTGNVRDQEWVRHPLQVGAWMDKEGHIEKCKQVLIPKPRDVTEHFRDPQLFNYQGQLYALVGAQDLQEKGKIKLYKAPHKNPEKWVFLADLDFEHPASEYMIECPNLVFIDKKPVLIYCPQGLSKDQLAYDNIYPNVYQVFQSFDPEKGKLIGSSPIQNLDYGFEAYATQAFNTPKGDSLAVSWIGLPDIPYPTDHFDYQGALSLVKKLTVKDKQLYQYPVESLKNLRGQAEAFKTRTKSSNSYELELVVSGKEKADIILFANNQHKGFQISIDSQAGLLTIDRGASGIQYASQYETKRTCQIPNESVTLNIYVDQSIVEIFVNKGQKVLTSRFFPQNGESGIDLVSGQVSGYYYEMRY
ncbi:sucrose-6-phosphate hydrolase [Streptococcus didelphis]|uniref:sucrose-6-phosphate hydrolase n=1 Tax=Streptococcus didelphis TaxID=102886 RepID=UPI00036EEF42|nr:sucrose-6-phosphate hydrolase [Streptococcus didelphis]WMB29359.1 sucrose-6-phosphate hydrolase [Streptococcus didelphis]